MKRSIKGIMILAVAAVLGTTTVAFAHWGYGGDHMMGPGWHQGDGYYGNTLSSQEIANLDRQRAEFFKATEGLRQQLYEKQLALQSELGKKEPDTGKASKLQSEISRLRSTLDQKRLDYEIQARKAAPTYHRGYMMGHGPMMGYGPRGCGYSMR